jgi:hypothetical protein
MLFSKLLEKEEKEQEEKQAAKRLVAEQRRLARFVVYNNRQNLTFLSINQALVFAKLIEKLRNLRILN